MKNPDKVRAGKARWDGVSKEERTKFAKENGAKGGQSLWKKYKLTPIYEEKVN